VKRQQFEELLYQAMETEMGGEQVYLKALECARNEDLSKE
jgi:rubrerythrin